MTHFEEEEKVDSQGYKELTGRTGVTVTLVRLPSHSRIVTRLHTYPNHHLSKKTPDLADVLMINRCTLLT